MYTHSHLYMALMELKRLMITYIVHVCIKVMHAMDGN